MAYYVCPRRPAAPRRLNRPAPRSVNAFLYEVRRSARLQRLGIRTEGAYLQPLRDFIYFHDCRRPRHLGAPEVRAYLTHLAADRNAAASTQHVARSALPSGPYHRKGIRV